MKELDNKRLIKAYQKNGYTVNVFKSDLSDGEREKRDIQIRSEILKIAGTVEFPNKKRSFSEKVI